LTRHHPKEQSAASMMSLFQSLSDLNSFGKKSEFQYATPIDVSIMDQIYKAASQVDIWLGDYEGDTGYQEAPRLDRKGIQGAGHRHATASQWQMTRDAGRPSRVSGHGVLRSTSHVTRELGRLSFASCKAHSSGECGLSRRVRWHSILHEHDEGAPSGPAAILAERSRCG